MGSEPPGRRHAAALALALAATLGACSPAEEPAAPAAAPPLTGTFDQGRTQVERGLVRATLTLAEGAEPVEVTALELVVPGFTGAGPAEQGARFEPGRSIALAAALGPADCDAGVEPRPVEALVTLAGRGAPARLELDDPRGVAGTLHQRACAAQRVAETAPLAWRPGWATEGSGADLVSVGRLDVGPVTGEQPVTIERLEATTLFSYDVAPTTLAPGERATLDVRLTPTRCDLHAVAEDKLGFAPPVRLRVGDEEVVTPAWVPLEQRGTPLDALLERCGTG